VKRFDRRLRRLWRFHFRREHERIYGALYRKIRALAA